MAAHLVHTTEPRYSEIAYPFGKAAKALDRTAPRGGQATEAEASDLYRSMIAFAGRYELDGKRLIYRPEVSWNETWNGTTQERVIEISGDRLETNSLPTINPVTGTRSFFSLIWQRV